MRRFILSLALLVCASPSVASSQLVCASGADRVTYDGKTATYFRGGALVASSACGGTRMAVYDMICQDSPAFRFLFADAKTARLDANGTSTPLACHP